MIRQPAACAVTILAVTFSIATPPTAASAASDSLSVAQAKLTDAQVAADNASSQYDDAQAQYYSLADDARRTNRRVAELRRRMSGLLKVVRQRAIVVYMGGSPGPLDGILTSTGDALDAARRAVLINSADAASDTALQDFGAASDDLTQIEHSLQAELQRQTRVLHDLRARQSEVQRTLTEAQRAERGLRRQLERERRMKEYAELSRQVREAARERARPQARAGATPATTNRPQTGNGGASPPTSSPGRPIGDGQWVCPVQGSVSFNDTYGSPRSGGRSHKGVDMFAPRGTPTVAVVAGSVFFQSDPLGGLAAYVNGNDGNTYYYAHLNDYVGGGRSVSAGELIGHLGNTGDASDAPPQLHFEIRPGGPNGPRINPYVTVRAHC